MKNVFMLAEEHKFQDVHSQCLETYQGLATLEECKTEHWVLRELVTHSSPCIVRDATSERLNWARHATRLRREEIHTLVRSFSISWGLRFWKRRLRKTISFGLLQHVSRWKCSDVSEGNFVWIYFFLPWCIFV
jgi:hypothetical protein